jgi:uncharacterized repeat protein (TIGR01451 family)
VTDLNRAARARRPLAALLATLVLSLGATGARADGSRDLFPSGYVGSRANLDLQPAQAYVGVVRRRTFVYVYAQAGEYILLGSSNRIDGNAAGNIRVYNPQSFGARGDETIPVASDFDCASGATGGATGPHFSGDPAGAGNITGAIGTRLAELAGPRSADNSAGVADAWTPCAYRAPTTGIYGVLFAVSDGGAGPDGVIDPPARSNITVAAWEVTVRANATATADLRGRAFTYAFSFFTGGNSRPVNSSLYYISSDGFRYRQTLRNFDPNGYVLYANALGFLDNGQPLYQSVRGNNAEVFPFVPAGSGVTAQPAQYPAFFVDVDPAGANAAQVSQVLGALSIPLTPVDAQLNSVGFVGAVGTGQTIVNLGGTFSLNTTNTLTFQIVISRDGVNFDPALPANRVLTGLAPGGTVNVAWDGRDNAGVAFPPGNFPYRTVGRNGEVHFPAIDAEGNPDGGPTITRLNGSGTAAQRRTVYFDDRGYVTSNGTAVGVLNGTLCPTGTGGTPPAPAFNLIGVDSATSYRQWPTNGNSNADCVAQPTTQGFGDAKGLELWTHVETVSIDEVVEIVAPIADLAIVKDDGLTTVLPGGAITYTLVASNNGPSPANDARVSDPPVANLTVTGVACTATTGGANCPLPGDVTVAALQGGGIAIPLFAAGSSITFSVTGIAGASGTINNIATVTPPAGTTDPVPGNNSDPDVTVIAAPELALAKSNGTTTVLPGASTTYTLTVSNIGATATVGPIGVTDVLPAGITIAAGAVPLSGANAASWTCNAAAQVITCSSNAAIAAGASSVFAFTANVAANASGTLVNRARVGGGGDPLNPNPPDEGTTTPCTGNGVPRGCAIDSDTVPPPVIASVKSVNAGADGFASPGEVLTYSIVVSNTGGPTISPVLVTDPIPANTTYVGGSATGPGATFAANTVSWSIPAGASFPVTLTFQVTVANPIPAGVTSILNTHTLNGLPGCGTPPCTTTPTQPQVTSVKSVNAGADGFASPGEVLTYSIVVSNTGGPTTTPVVVTDPIPANTTYVPASATGPGATFAANTVSWSIPAGASFPVTLTFQVTVADPIPAGVTAILNTHTLNGNPGCGTPPCTSTPTQPLVASVKSVNAGADNIASPGEVLTYSIVVSNTGGPTTAPVLVTDPIPANTTYVPASATGPGATFAANTVSWSIPAGASFPVTLTFQVTVANPIPAGVTSILNTHTLNGNPGCGTPPCTSTPTPSALTIAKTVADAGGNNQAEPGETLTYTITIGNTGGSAASNVGVSDAIDANTSFVSASNGGTASAGVVTWTGLTVPANGSLVLTLTVRVNNPLPIGVTILRNGVAITGNPLPDCTVASPPANCASIPVPRLSLTKTASATTVQAPGTVVYTITVRNIGGVALANVGISDPIPAGISAFAWTCAGTGVACPSASGSGAITQTVPSLPVGAQLVYTVNATVAANPPASIVNTATVTPTTLVNCAPANTPAPCSATVPLGTQQTPVAVPVDGPLARIALLLLLAASGLLVLRRRAAID